MDVAKMTIISSDLTKIPETIKLSKDTYSRNHQAKPFLGIHLQSYRHCKHYSLSNKWFFIKSNACEFSNGVK